MVWREMRNTSFEVLLTRVQAELARTRIVVIYFVDFNASRIWLPSLWAGPWPYQIYASNVSANGEGVSMVSGHVLRILFITKNK